MKLRDADANCSALKLFEEMGDEAASCLNVSNWNTSRVTSMERMVRKVQCDSFSFMPRIDVSKWDVSSVIDMTAMWQGTRVSPDAESWDTRSVQYLDNMFTNSECLTSHNNCYLRTLGTGP